MKYKESFLKDALIIELDKKFDQRGYFSRAFCKDEFNSLNLHLDFPQINLCYNTLKGTLRGLHAQCSPFEEIKYVRCLHGAIFDVIVDMRPNSPTYMKHLGIKLSEENGLGLYIPKGFYHGYITLEASSSIMYCVSTMYNPSAESGLRFDDPKLDIHWPVPVSSISQKDLSWPYIQI